MQYLICIYRIHRT